MSMCGRAAALGSALSKDTSRAEGGGAAVEALGVAGDLAVEHVEIVGALRAVLGDAVRF
jgi:hypothetical protein